ncbi:MAG: hypothetical protein J5449_09855, partial [Oscillospiraceae bacterium]|nr:hypothetical protein [Oscillospiraceae bacterium]
VTDSGLLAVEEYADEQSYHTIYTFYRGMSVFGSADNRVPLSFAGLTDDGLFMIETGERGDGTLHLRQITPEGRTLDLGAIPSALDASAFYDVQVDRFLAASGKVTLGIGRYAGTSHYLSEYSFIEAEPGRENSVRELDSGESRDGSILRLAVGEDGGAVMVPALPGELRIGWGEEDGALEVWRDGSWHIMSERFAPQLTDGVGYRRIVQHMETIGDTAYVTLACAHFSPLDSLGWRDGYALLDMLYLAVDGDGSIRELASVDHGAELYGEVWFIKGSDTLLWRQCVPEGSEYMYAYGEADHTFAIPIAANCVKDDGSPEAEGQIYRQYIGNASYYGYEIPEQPSAGRVCLELDRDGSAVSISVKSPSTLLAIDFDVPESLLAGAAATLPLERRETDEDNYWFWTKLRALEDGVRVRIERVPDDDGMTHLARIEGAFPVGETVYDGMINRGEFIALRASLPWHSELRVSVSKDGESASYIFGEDNYLHLETEELIHPTLMLNAAPLPGLSEFLANGEPRALPGTWLYYSPLTGEIAATLRFTEEDGLLIETGEDFWQLGTSFEWLYSDDWGASDLLCLHPEDEAVITALSGLETGGDYLMTFFRTDGEELLRLTQVNNGDGSLDKLLPDAESEWQYGFTLRRSEGMGDAGARRRNAGFYAIAARYDAEDGVVWLREVREVDSYPGGGAIRCAISGAPCLPYRIASEEAAKLLASCRSPGYPMCEFKVVTDEDGAITQLLVPED